MKIRPVGAELFHASGRPDRHDEANIGSSQFCEGAYKRNQSSCHERMWERVCTFNFDT